MIQVRGASANDVIAIKAGGLLYHWDGIVWSLVPGSSVSSNLSVGDRPFAIVAPNDIWHAGGGPEIVQHWDGTCWRQLSAPDGRSPDDVVIGATSKKVFLVSAPTISRLDRAP
jgi:hypothetical protein